MTEELDGPQPWKLGDEEIGALTLLCDALRKTASLARSGEQLIGIGEAWDAIQCALDGRDIDVNVQVSVGFRRGDKNEESGLFMCVRVNDEEIVLDELNTQWSSDIGSDHFTNVYCSIDPNGGTDTSGIYDWLDKLREVLQADDVELEVARDHA